jgi:hypothetical protein
MAAPCPPQLSHADKAFSFKHQNSELHASSAVIGEGAVHLPTLLLPQFFDFALQFRRVVRRWLSEDIARQRVYGVVEQQVPYFFTFRIFKRDLRALVDTGATCFILSKCAYNALQFKDEVYARYLREPLHVKVIYTLNGRIIQFPRCRREDPFTSGTPPPFNRALFTSASWRASHKLMHFSAWIPCRSWA